jgi:predicted transcriptional regulator
MRTCGKLCAMATTLKPEFEAKLSQLAERTHRSKEEALEEALNQALAYNDWFAARVDEGMAALDRGDAVPDEQVLAWIKARERSERERS